MRRIDWVTASFLVLTPLVSAVFVPIYVAKEGWHWSLFLLFAFFWIATAMSITGGYHRLFAHKSYEAHPLMKLLYLYFGSAAFQGSVMKWGTDHRRHHRLVDSDQDPYSINKGFWYAHMGWLFLQEDPQYAGKFAPDLASDPMIAFQNKYYGVIATITGFGTPLAIGALLGMPWGGLLFGGILRVVFAHHSTFFINSLCHYWGRQPYSDKHTARDSFLMALFTFGEGYHNFHHEFQLDYRNGVKWYQWDPTKWLIRLTTLIGWSGKLKTIPREAIIRAVMEQDAKRLTARGIVNPRLEELRAKVLHAQEDWKKLRADWAQRKQEFKNHQREKFLQLKADLAVTKLEFKKSYAQWKAYVNTLSAMPALQGIAVDEN